MGIDVFALYMDATNINGSLKFSLVFFISNFLNSTDFDFIRPLKQVQPDTKGKWSQQKCVIKELSETKEVVSDYKAYFI